MRTLVLAASLALLFACSRTPRPELPGLALQLEFEVGTQPVAITDLTSFSAPNGLSSVPGLEGRALRFDGSGAALAIPGIEALGLARAMTLEFFVLPADWRNPYVGSAALESMVSHSDDFTVAIDSVGWSLVAQFATQGSETPVRLSGGALTPDSWHHVALVLDAERGRAFLALDGVEVSTANVSTAVRIQPNLDLVVGTWFKQNQAFCGAIDSIRLWSRALSVDELAQRAQVISASRNRVGG